MQTSYFFSSKINSAMQLVSVAGKIPSNIQDRFGGKIKTYRDLVPPSYLVWDYKNGKTCKEDYTRIYKEKILNSLDASIVYRNLQDAVILCWERPEAFCHRHLIAKWIRDRLQIKIEEL